MSENSSLPHITYEQLREACSPGGSSILRSITELAPAAGPHASVAPAKFVDTRSNSTFAFETRYIDDEPVTVALIDSKQSQINRAEATIAEAVRSGEPIFKDMPHIVVTYDDPDLHIKTDHLDLELPHRAFDGHIRWAKDGDKFISETERYLELRNSNNANALPLLNQSPFSLIGGAWDSSRKSNQARFRSAMTGEIIGVLGDQQAVGDDRLSWRGGARLDPVSMGFEMPKSLKAYAPDNKKVSSLGLGGIPPTLNALGGVSCSRIIRSWIVSFASFRQLHFFDNVEDNITCRALLAALALNSIARSEAELYLRANCDLVELDLPQVTLDQRYGKSLDLAPLSIDVTNELLATAVEKASSIDGVDFSSGAWEITGNPDIAKSKKNESEQD